MEAKSVIAWKEGALGVEMRVVLLLALALALALALVFVFERTWMVCGFADAVAPQSATNPKRSNEGTHVCAFEDVACGREERGLHFLGVIDFG